MSHACDLCGSPRFHQLPQDYRISICAECGFIYVSQRRSSAEIAASWAEVYSSGAYSPEWPAVAARLFYVAAWISQEIGLNGKRLLDIGAGNGRFMSEAKRRGASVFGIEPAAKGLLPEHVVARAVEDGPLGEQFDIVTINWTLENTGDCMAMLRFAREHCKPDGWVVVATGSRILVPFKKPLSKYLNKDIPADLHCFRWSYQSLYRAMGAAGIKLIQFNPYEECDWLVVAGKPADVHVWAGDTNPNAVLAYFDMWSKVCP